ncbi:flagellar protein FliT [Peribacillus deserti]|uniref:Flagellar protein FliT n=1 Tax=Peribacillus deserti TaxID=673318 RepID=A0ABS2QCM7_9BACI|nr:flagellar protein FliT [Peribacillus deserti]MBM7690894.1 flagellar protein FliT [Peribacillus deserti]
MNRLMPYRNLSIELIELINTSSEEKRNEQIAEIERILELRQAILAEITAPFSDEENITGSLLIGLEKQVTEKLSRIKRDIQIDIKKLQSKKEGNQKYVNPYQSLTTDGYFYDKRK